MVDAGDRFMRYVLWIYEICILKNERNEKLSKTAPNVYCPPIGQYNF